MTNSASRQWPPRPSRGIGDGVCAHPAKAGHSTFYEPPVFISTTAVWPMSIAFESRSLAAEETLMTWRRRAGSSKLLAHRQYGARRHHWTHSPRPRRGGNCIHRTLKRNREPEKMYLIISLFPLASAIDEQATLTKGKTWKWNHVIPSFWGDFYGNSLDYWKKMGWEVSSSIVNPHVDLKSIDVIRSACIKEKSDPLSADWSSSFIDSHRKSRQSSCQR